MMKQLLEDSLLFGANAPFIEGLYEDYLQNPASVPVKWREYFDRLQPVQGQVFRDVSHRPVIESLIRLSKEHRRRGDEDIAREAASEMGDLTTERKQISALQLINAFRFLGVRHADLDRAERNLGYVKSSPSQPAVSHKARQSNIAAIKVFECSLASS